jgi:hypothetical protein
MVRKIVRPETGGHRGALQRRAPSGLLPIALLLVAGACDASSPSIGPTVTPAATPTARPAPSPAETKKPFLWALVANGSSGFVEVTGASAGSVCSVKAFLKSGREISSPALKPRTVTDPSRGVSWSDSDKDGPLLILPSPAPSPGENAYWRVTCRNNAFDPPSGTTTFAFKTP